jgi:hypothetical protein
MFNLIIYHGSNSTYINKTGNLVVGLVLQKHNLKEKIGSTFSAEISHDSGPVVLSNWNQNR